jgi:hypothetical protein
MRHNTFKLALAIVTALSVFSFAQIPVIKITTQNNQEVGSGNGSVNWGGTGGEQPYVRITNFEMTGAKNSSFNITRSSQPDSIRVRGNSTAQAGKRPYRIKFDKKVSMFGRTAAKSWVLLAEFYDGTFALNAIVFRLGKKMGLEFTNSSEFVEVYINNSNKGIYHLTEQLQVNPGRVDIDEDKGWLVEFDYHKAEGDEIKFTTSNYSLFTRIRSPEVESNFTVNNPKVSFVKDEINDLCNKMAASGFPENGYRDLIDLESWAKYLIIQQFMDNFDFNGSNTSGMGSNYAYKDAGNRIKAGPLWDFDLAASVKMNNFPKHYQTDKFAIEPYYPFHKRLWADPAFKAKFKKTWDAYKSEFSSSVINAFVDSISNALSSKIQVNRWGNNAMYGSGASLTTQQHNTEVSGLKDWWSKRLTWFDQQLTSMNIDTSIDIIQTPLKQPSSSSRPSSSSVNSSSSSVGNSSSSVRSSSSVGNSNSSSSGNSSSVSSSSSNGGTAPIIMFSQTASGNRVLAIKNGIELAVQNKARVEVYSISGRLEKTMNFINGVYSVSLNDLPKGMHVAKISFSDGKTHFLTLTRRYP